MLGRSAAVLLLLAVLTPSVAAHTPGQGNSQTHLSVAYFALQPNQSKATWIETGEGPWEAGMVFVLYLCFRDGARDADVTLELEDGTPVESWRLADDACHKKATQIPLDDGPYHLNVTNRGSTNSSLWYYFDQTCNCTLKLITLPGGFVVFSYDLKEGRRYNIGFPLVDGWSTQGTVATLEYETVSWPDAFAPIVEAAAEGPGWMNLTFEAVRDGPHYVFVHERAGVTLNPQTGQPEPVHLTPLVEELDGGKSPGPALALAALALASVGVALRRRRA